MLIAEDTYTYNIIGRRLAEVWQGLSVPNDELTSIATASTGAGWGMNYLVGGIYYVFGQSIIVAQSFCAVVGAATAPMIYYCAKNLFNNKKVSEISAIAVAVFPSLIIWSSQLLKDGLIIFLLVFTMTMVLQLQKKFGFLAITGLIFALFGILSLRFYIFYMVVISVVGSFVVGLGDSGKAIVRNTMVVVLIGLGLTYLGVLHNASTEFDTFGSLERIQRSRRDLAGRATSGYEADLDVSTSAGAIAAVPIGLAYLMLAPFPWQISNYRQTITLPEVLLWWSLIPLLIMGLWYTIKNRLRTSIPILLFTLMLTLSYSIFQGNVGTAYRQRAQIQVFFIIFIAVGWRVLREKKENQQMVKQIKRQRLNQRLQKQT
ncbi:MAG: glycosyltransferase family 39 protein [Acidobacteriota bacterium]|nr:glycosyltransferase family 39 protein [Acidobacteriota bacterium]